MSNRSQTPEGLALRRDRYALLTARVRNYQILAGVLALAVLASIASSIYFQARRTVQLHVVEVDALGDVRAHGPPGRLDRTDERIVRAQLREWIELARTVTPDEQLQRSYVDRAATRTAGAARSELNAYRQAQNPFIRSSRETVEVRDVSSLPVASTGTWEIQWREVERATMTGQVRSQSKWRALVTFRWRDPTPAEYPLNPLGFEVLTLSWTRLSDQESTEGDPS